MAGTTCKITKPSSENTEPYKSAKTLLTGAMLNCNFKFKSDNNMKKIQSSQPTAFAVLVKSLGAVINSFFQSSSNREFKRLKDFITS